MWVIHACLSSPAAPCDPMTWGQWLEAATAFGVAATAWLGFLAFLLSRT